MIKWFRENTEFKLNSADDEICLGLYTQAGDAYPHNIETDETDFDAEPKTVYRTVIGLLIVSFIIYW